MKLKTKKFFGKKITLKWRIFSYFLSFTLLLLLFLWSYQTFFLESFYKSVKTQNLISTAEDISENINSANLQELINSHASKNELGIRITDFDLNDICIDNITENSIAHRLRKSEMFLIYQKAQENNGSTFQSYQLIMNPPLRPGAGIYNEYENFERGVPKAKGILQNLLYAKLSEKSDGSIVMILVDTIVTPLNSTVKTLGLQLVRISVIMLFASLILAFILARSVAAPIEKINKAAKKLAHGKYDPNLTSHGYEEISQLNETLSNAAHELSKTETLRHELIANVSHDLRTPLTMIVGYGEVMRDIPGENTPENVQVIIDEAQRLSTLVNGLLDISKLQSGVSSIECEQYNFTASVEDITERYNKMMESKSFHFDFVKTGEVFVSADKIKITQVIYNLLNNAVNYSNDNKNIVLRQIVKDNVVRLEITDHGEGIPKEHIDNIWDRYYKVDKTHKRAVVGTGLGLSIVKSILQLHGAKYGVESDVGVGSTFWFELNTL